MLATDFNACNAYAGGLARAQALRCPVLFVSGERDAMTPPKAAQSLLESIAGARMVRVPNGGHAVMAEQPDAVRIALSEFIGAANRRLQTQA